MPRRREGVRLHVIKVGVEHGIVGLRACVMHHSCRFFACVVLFFVGFDRCDQIWSSLRESAPHVFLNAASPQTEPYVSYSIRLYTLLGLTFCSVICDEGRWYIQVAVLFVFLWIKVVISGPCCGGGPALCGVSNAAYPKLNDIYT